MESPIVKTVVKPPHMIEEVDDREETISTVEDSNKENVSNEVTQDVPTEYTYSHLKKMSQRNAHTSKVRKIQSAAIKIQRAWRRHQYNA